MMIFPYYQIDRNHQNLFMNKAMILVLHAIILMQSTKCDVVTDHKLL